MPCIGNEEGNVWWLVDPSCCSDTRIVPERVSNDLQELTFESKGNKLEHPRADPKKRKSVAEVRTPTTLPDDQLTRKRDESRSSSTHPARVYQVARHVRMV